MQRSLRDHLIHRSSASQVRKWGPKEERRFRSNTGRVRHRVWTGSRNSHHQAWGHFPAKLPLSCTAASGPCYFNCSNLPAGQIEGKIRLFPIHLCLPSPPPPPQLPSTLYAVWTGPLPRATAPLSVICMHLETWLPWVLNLTHQGFVLLNKSKSCIRQQTLSHSWIIERLGPKPQRVRNWLEMENGDIAASITPVSSGTPQGKRLPPACCRGPGLFVKQREELCKHFLLYSSIATLGFCSQINLHGESSKTWTA